jgi:hypothetical protein
MNDRFVVAPRTSRIWLEAKSASAPVRKGEIALVVGTDGRLFHGGERGISGGWSINVGGPMRHFWRDITLEKMTPKQKLAAVKLLMEHAK